MARESGRNHTRERIAHLAARLMADDGIEDHALAKRKAARQAGIADRRQMPSNDEIDVALQAYRDLYRREHTIELRELRQLALEIMGELVQFNPYLTGSVLSGSAGKYAGIHLHLFFDNAKSVEHFLLDHQIDFRAGATRLYAGNTALDVPTLSFDRAGIDVHLLLLTPRELRTQVKASAEGKPVERAKPAAVLALLNAQ